MLSKYNESRGVVLAKVNGRFAALFRLGLATTEGGRGFSLAEVFPASGFMIGIGLALLALALLFAAIFTTGTGEAAAFLAIVPAASTRDLKTILGEVRALQDKFKGKAMPEDEGAKFDALCQEAKTLQDANDRADRVAEMEAAERKSRRTPVGGATLPDDEQPGGEGDEFKSERPVGYMTLGDFVTSQKGLVDFIRSGRPKGNALLAKLNDPNRPGFLFGRKRGAQAGLVPIYGSEYKALREIHAASGIESKAVPTIGANVIEPTLISDLVRVDEHDTLKLRDVLDISRTNSDAVRYTRLTSYTRAAATVANSAAKPQAAMAMDSVTVPVKTLAVWIPVEEQQLQDLPALTGIINGELLYDLDKLVEELAIYGDGAGENFDGIIPDADVLAARVVADDTLIDKARRMITDVRRDGYDPNALLVDPLDWEDIVLMKGTDNRYVWVVVTEDGVSRLWGVPVVETVAMTELATDDRHMLLGDFRRGATLWDRMDSAISVGWINDQFTKNQRTILAESRAAFGVRRPKAFRKFKTADNGS